MKIAALIFCVLIAAPVRAVEDAAKAEKTVTLDAKDQSVADVLKQIATQTGCVVLAEKLATGKITASIKDATVEDALKAVTKTAGLQWMRVYVPAGSAYAKDGDALAAQVRLLLGLRFPDVIIAPSASYAPVVHLQKESTASSFISKMSKETGLVPVYLVTNDKAYTRKLAKDEAKAKTRKYINLSKEALDLFLSMTPEERAEAMRQGMQMTMQMDPQAMMDMMKTVFEMDPQAMSEMNSRAMQAIMSLDPAVRKNMLRASMRSQFQMLKNMDPAQMQQFQKETAEIVKELIESGEMPAGPMGSPTPVP